MTMPAIRVEARGMVSANLWTTWTEIAIDHERSAWVIRREEPSVAQDERLPFMVREFQEAIQAVTSAAFALDGWFGAAHQVLEGGKPRLKNALRPDTLVGAVRRVSSDPAVRSEAFRGEVDWIFTKDDGARGRLIHHEPRAVGGKDHPFMAGPVMAEYADYKAEEASRAAQVLRTLFVACRDFPKPPLVRWSTSSRHTLDRFIDTIDEVDHTGQ